MIKRKYTNKNYVYDLLCEDNIGHSVNNIISICKHQDPKRFAKFARPQCNRIMHELQKEGLAVIIDYGPAVLVEATGAEIPSPIWMAVPRGGKK